MLRRKCMWKKHEKHSKALKISKLHMKKQQIVWTFRLLANTHLTPSENIKVVIKKPRKRNL